MRIALVTCLLGEYDKLKPIYNYQGFDAICFSDQIFENTMGWTIIPIHQSYSTTDERVRICRRLKIMIHEYLPNYDKWIWTDLSLKWKVNPLNILDYLQDKEIATFSYYNRNCLYEEGSACIKRGKDSESVITKHLKKYQDENFPTNYGLVETTVMIRTNSSLAIDFCKLWWAEVENGSRRDQLSFNYVCWKLNNSYSVIPGHRVKNDFTEWTQHDEIIYLPQSI